MGDRSRGASVTLVRRLPLAWVLLLLTTTGCAYTLRNSSTGEEVRCGTVPMPAWWTYTRAEREAFGELRCIETAALAAMPPSPIQMAARPPAPVPELAREPSPAPPAAEPEPPAPPPPAAAEAEPTAPPPVAPARPQITEFKPTEMLHDIFFDFDAFEVRAEAQNVLNANAAWLRANPEYSVLIEGHCDERGTNEYNLALGEHRARAAMNYLVAQGVEARRLLTFSYGEERPFCVERTEACWAQNRRSHFLVKREP
jgi:peptidoglycan-associated lipoprotein